MKDKKIQPKAICNQTALVDNLMRVPAGRSIIFKISTYILWMNHGLLRDHKWKGCWWYCSLIEEKNSWQSLFLRHVLMQSSIHFLTIVPHITFTTVINDDAQTHSEVMAKHFGVNNSSLQRTRFYLSGGWFVFTEYDWDKNVMWKKISSWWSHSTLGILPQMEPVRPLSKKPLIQWLMLWQSKTNLWRAISS